MIRIVLPVVLGWLCLMARPATAQLASASARIRVTDAINSDPLEGATVSFPDLALGALTDRTGIAVVEGIPPGDHRFEITMPGYGKASGLLHLEPGARADDHVGLAVQPFEIAGIMVDGRRRWSTTLQRSGFYERSKLGFGKHLDRLALRRRYSPRLDHAIEHLLRSGCIADPEAGTGGAAISLGNSGGPIPTQTMGTSGSRPVVFVDGVPWRGEIKEIPIEWVEGLELYKSSGGTPAQYAGWAPCGVILVWTG